jgi:hypothetical protein
MYFNEVHCKQFCCLSEFDGMESVEFVSWFRVFRPSSAFDASRRMKSLDFCSPFAVPSLFPFSVLFHYLAEASCSGPSYGSAFCNLCHFQVCLESYQSDSQKGWMSDTVHCHWLANQLCTQRSVALCGSCMNVEFQHFSSQMLSSRKR